MVRVKTIGYFAIVILAVFVLSGCARLRWLDDKAGEMFFNEASEQASSTDAEARQVTSITDFKNITREQKAKIDQWLDSNNLNRYGDAIGTVYTGGTPLFDEITGQAKERYQYILEKIPDVLGK